MSSRKSAAELAKMRKAGRVVAEMHDCIRQAIRPGVTTRQLDQIGADVIERRGATSNFLHYQGYPNVICASPNQVIVHGIPNDTPLQEGDLLSIDCGAIVDGYHGDAAFSAPVGSASPEVLELIDLGKRALDAGIKAMIDGNRIGDIGFAVQSVAEAGGGSVVREYTGHGIGTHMHESPEVPNHGMPGKGMKLKHGLVLAVEPMICAGSPATRTLSDGWTVVTVDGSLSVHWEHTIAITEDGPEILTKA